MDLDRLIEARVSVRRYASAAAHEDIMLILAQAQRAPSWKNLQASRTYVAEDAERDAALRACLPPFNLKSSANATLVVTTFVRDTAGFSNGEPDNEAGNLWGAYDLGLHDAYLILAAKDAGFDTLIMGIRDADSLRRALDIPQNEQIMSVIAVGKAAEAPAPKPRKPLDEVVRCL
ncbi:MAG: nitroreductase [Clostridiales bacterium]|nr:nitroreductase [Clostridiales bacterium]